LKGSPANGRIQRKENDPMSRIAVIALGLALLAAPAIAQEEPLAPYNFNLDLSDAETPEGAARIYADIRRQSVRICRALEVDGTVTRKVRACREEVRANAVAAAGKPLVTALWRDDAVLLAER
jgi:UrcA family protein